MRKLHTFLSLALIAAGSLTIAPAIHAQDPAVQQRMRERVPQIDQLKTQGKVGENNRGFLEARGEVDSATASLISAENSDPQAAYVTISQTTGETPETVGRARAAQIANRSATGVWLQSPNGSWYRK